MKTNFRTTAQCILCSTLISCNTGKTIETANDSTQHSLDTIAAPAPATVTIVAHEELLEEPLHTSYPKSLNFPEYSDEIYTDDSLEAITTIAVVDLLNKYAEEKFVTVSGNYTVEYQVGNDGDDSTVDGKETKSRTWYYDNNGRLNAYVMTSESEAYDKVDDEKIAIYLFTNEQLTAVYSYHLSSSQMYFLDRERIMVSQCPDCGIKISDEGSGFTASTVDQSDVSYLTDTFFKEYNEMLKDLKSESQLLLKDNHYTFKVKKSFADDSYLEEYVIDQLLHSKLVGQ